MLLTLRALTPAKTKRKLKKPAPTLRNKDLSRAEVMAPFHLLGPALLRPTSPLLQLHQPADLLLPLLLDFAAPKTLSFIRSPECRVQL
jgi:hypothetical protein